MSGNSQTFFWSRTHFLALSLQLHEQQGSRKSENFVIIYKAFDSKWILVCLEERKHARITLNISTIVHDLLTNIFLCLHNQLHIFGFSDVVNLLSSTPGTSFHL